MDFCRLSGQDLLDLLLRQLVSQMPQTSKLPLLVLGKQTKGSGWYLVVEECSEARIVAPPAHCGLPSQALKPFKAPIKKQPQIQAYGEHGCGIVVSLMGFRPGYPSSNPKSQLLTSVRITSNLSFDLASVKKPERF